MTNEFILSIVLCIGQVESKNKDSEIGKDGERGRYQITEAKWVEYTNEPFTEAHNQIKSNQVCSWIVEDIIIRLQRRATNPTVRSIYAVYNGGWNGRSSKVVQARAKRFEKLWREKYDPKRKDRK